ncbi:MAG: SoxR reducing system RseC family protein [Xanthomonadales bacterium]|nr:SoxR reducing system RseC family protein [Xanthomonadales bacterium]
MIEQQARVIEVNGEFATVEMGAQSGCPACDAGKGCGAGIFGRLLRRNPLRLELRHSGAADAGEPVLLGLRESLFLRLVLRLYGLPLVAGMIAAAIAHALAVRGGAGPAVADLGVAVAGLGAAWLALKIPFRDTKPDIGLSDIQWLEERAGSTACAATPLQSSEREV